MYDIRDGEAYTVRKLADGNCWMTENLRLGDAEHEITLTPQDSNVVTDFVLPIGGNGATIESAWDKDEAHVFINNKVSKGALYNFFTAIAGSQTSDQTTTPTQSICPKGFTMPANRDYYNLVKTVYKIPFFFGPDAPEKSYEFDTRLLNFPLNFIFAGYIGGIAAGRGREYPNNQSTYLVSRAYYENRPDLASTFFISNVTDYMVIIEEFGVSKARGGSIRCVTKSI